MKSCPNCNRTYADDTLAFCLDDGSPLSAPFDPQARQGYRPSGGAPPPTEILHSSPTRSETVPTPRLQPTIQTFPAAPLPGSYQSPAAAKSSSKAWIAAAVALLVILMIAGVGALLIGRTWLNSNGSKEQNNSTPITNNRSATNDNSRTDPSPEASPSPERLDVAGHWVGTNDETPATLTIEKSDTDSYDGTEYVAESTPVKLAVEIKIDQETRHITINETRILQGAGSWNLGFNQGTISADGQTMSGTAKDVKEKVYSWSFTKQERNSKPK